MLAVAVKEAIKLSDSLLESSITPYSGAPNSSPSRANEVVPAVLVTTSFSFFIDIASPQGSTMPEDVVKARSIDDAGVVDDVAERDDRGESLPDHLGEPSSSRRAIVQRQPMIFILMTTNMEMLSRSHPALKCTLIKPRLG